MVRHRHNVHGSGFGNLFAKFGNRKFVTGRTARLFSLFKSFHRKELFVILGAIHSGRPLNAKFGQFSVRPFPSPTKELRNGPYNAIAGPPSFRVDVDEMVRFRVGCYFQSSHNILF